MSFKNKEDTVFFVNPTNKVPLFLEHFRIPGQMLLHTAKIIIQANKTHELQVKYQL